MNRLYIWDRVYDVATRRGYYFGNLSLLKLDMNATADSCRTIDRLYNNPDQVAALRPGIGYTHLFKIRKSQNHTPGGSYCSI